MFSPCCLANPFSQRISERKYQWRTLPCSCSFSRHECQCGCNKVCLWIQLLFVFTITGEDKKKDTKPCCMAGVLSTVICTFYILDLKWIADAMWNMNLFYVTMMSQVNGWFQRHLTVVYFVTLLNKTIFSYFYTSETCFSVRRSLKKSGTIFYFTMYCSSLL